MTEDLRIALLVNGDVASNVALNLLLPAWRDRVVAVFVSDRVGSPTAVPPLLGQLAFVELDLFRSLVFPLAERLGPPEGRYATFAEIESAWGIPVTTLTSARQPAALAALRAVGADLFVSIRFGKILGAEAIAIPRLGVLNLHSGLLPRYRGILATLQALLNGDREIGCTLHRIDTPAIDEGPIIATARLAVDRRRSLLWHVLSLYPLGARLVRDAVDRIAAGRSPVGTPQPADGGYYSFPTDEDLSRFTAAGWRLFDREDVRELIGRYGIGAAA